MIKTLTYVALAGATAVMTTSTMAADQRIITDKGVASFSFFKPAQVRAEVGTTGYGGAISYNVHPKVAITAGYNGGDISWSDDLSVNGTDYDLDMDNELAYLNAEIRPWANWFYTALGVGYVDSHYDITGRPGADGTIKIDGSTFAANSGIGNVRGKLGYGNNIAPYVGFGFSPAITNRWGIFGEIGAYYTGNPTVSLANSGSSTAVAEDGKTIAQALENERNSIRNDDEYEWLPVAKSGVSFRF